MDSTHKFDGYADDYTAGRPDYAQSLIDSFYNDYGLTCGSVIADIGSGTGKFAASLLKKGNIVNCVEPNSDMRRVAEIELARYPNFRSVAGDAENTTLESGSVDFVTTAQAFHWFDVLKFREECIRILSESGKVALIWNVRDMDDPLNRELWQIFTDHCPNFSGFSGGMIKDDPRIRDFFRDRYDRVAFDNPLFFDKDKFISRCLSGSYSIREGDKDYEVYMARIIAVFDRYSQNGTVTMGNKSVAYIGSVK